MITVGNIFLFFSLILSLSLSLSNNNGYCMYIHTKTVLITILVHLQKNGVIVCTKNVPVIVHTIMKMNFRWYYGQTA